MKIQIVKDGLFLPKGVKETVTSRISKSLNSIVTQDSEFVVNDTLHFRRQRSGKITTCVMNSATYISKTFQQNLATFDGCFGETKIDGQNIDGVIVTPFQGDGFRIKNKDRLLEVLHCYLKENDLPARSIYTLFPMFYGMYVDNCKYDISCLPSTLKELFEHEAVDTKFKIGVEFETGNVASSFRAINKLFVLFQQGLIDAGVFITSIDKPSAATRIWPVANRNGSFQELRNRKYEEQISLPLICIGFAPDKFSSDAPFLGKDLNLFKPTFTGKQDESGTYNIFTGENDEELLLPVGI